MRAVAVCVFAHLLQCAAAALSAHAIAVLHHSSCHVHPRAPALVARAPGWFEKNMIPASQAAATVRSLTEKPGTIIVIDANNVRGAVNFRISKLQLTRMCEHWAVANGLSNRVIIAWDHGLEQEGRILRSVCHTWAGPRQSADDLIAMKLVPGLFEHARDERQADGERVCVVTTDRELLHRCKRAAFESGASHGRLRFFGTRKFVSLLFHAAPSKQLANVEAQRITAAPPETEGDPPNADNDPFAQSFVRSEKVLKAFALTQRKLRAHERRRRRRPDGFAAPSAERTWVRVAMSERLRRLVVQQPEESEPNGKAPPPQVAAIAAQLASSSVKLSGAEGLLSDVRLDGKQRAILLRYGQALSRGIGGDYDSKAQQQQEQSGPLKPRMLPTKRQRRRKQRAVAEELLRAGDAGGAGLASSTERRQSLLVLERRQQIEGLEQWLRDELDG